MPSRNFPRSRNDEGGSELHLPILPEGTVTFLFTDIEGSTELLKKLRDAYATVLSDQRQILREIFTRWQGQEVDTQGDSFFVSFLRATEAVNASVEAQRALARHTWPEGVKVRVRMGIHTGEPLLAEEGYVGMAVHRAARIAHVGHGGQVLLSETTTPLVMDELPEGVGLVDLGRHHLKDMLRPEHISQLVIEGLPSKFPPLKSLEALPIDTFEEQPRHNLPAELTPFIGREEELVRIGDLLQDSSCRLLTLVGIGGIGKTRLALHTAIKLVDEYPDGVWLVEFADLRDPELVPQQAASVLGVSAFEEKDGRDVGDVLTAYINDKKLLIVLDNCEHLVEACGKFAEKLLKECPEIKLLVTSRENLGILGEMLYAVPTMEVPPDAAPHIKVEDFEAVQLFGERATAARPDFQTTIEKYDSVVSICQQLDGIPLAIELAAARVNVLTPEQIADRLKDRFQLLSTGPRTALPHQQTLLATMEWSYGLLTEPEKEMLQLLSLFTGGWTLDKVEEMLKDDPKRRSEALDLLANLVDKSLVTVEVKHGLARYGMLETVRQFATEKLSASENVVGLRTSHALLFLEMAEEADPQLRSSEQLKWLVSLGDDHENIRTALTWFIDQNQANEAARLVGAMGWFWFLRGYWQEAWKWLNKVIHMEHEPDPHLHAKALFRAGALDLIRGNLTGRVELVEEALEICQGIGDEEGMAWCLNLLGQAMTFTRQDLDLGAGFLSESIELFRKLNDVWGVAWSTRYLGQITELQGDVDRAVMLQKEALQQFEILGDIWNVAHSQYLLSDTVRGCGELEEVKTLYQKSYANCELVKDSVMGAHALQGLGMVALETQQYREAEEYLREALEVMQRIGDEGCASRVFACLSQIAQHDGDSDQATKFLKQSLQGYRKLNRADGMILNLARLASVEEASGSSERAAHLLGAAESYRETNQLIFMPINKKEYDEILKSFQDLKGNEIFEKHYAEGADMSLDDAIDYALGLTP